jgi:hypothetical protein
VFDAEVSPPESADEREHDADERERWFKDNVPPHHG